MLGDLSSPLGILVVAIGLRFVSNFVALGAAYKLTVGPRHPHPLRVNRMARTFHVFKDRLYQARAYRALRQTYAVREEAHARLDLSGRIFRICGVTLNWANIVLFIAFVVVAMVILVSTS